MFLYLAGLIPISLSLFSEAWTMAAPRPDFTFSEIMDNIKKTGDIALNYSKPHFQKAKDGWENVLQEGKTLLNHSEPYFQEAKNMTNTIWEDKIKPYLNTWIVIGVVSIIVILIKCPSWVFTPILWPLKSIGVLGEIGFEAVGVAKNSCASTWQSCCYGAFTPARSLFSLCQSVAMR